MTMTERTQKLLALLKPDAKAAVEQMLALAYKAGLNPQVHSSLRTFKEQNDLYAMGRTKTGKIVTNAKGGQSIHNYGLAVDVHFDNNKDGSAEWDEASYKKMWDLAVAAGLDKKGLYWSGLWTGRLRESAHFELTFGKGWREIAVQEGYDPVTLKPKKKA
jgi:peptidoglycan LD-endopeptidase CwlK